MCIRQLTHAETYHASINSTYRRDVVDRCIEVYGCLPKDVFGNTLNLRGERREKEEGKGRGRNLTKVEEGEWV